MRWARVKLRLSTVGTMPLRAVRWIVMCVRNQVRLMLLAAAGCRLGARVPADARKLAGVARGSDGWSHRSRGRRRGLHAGGVEARPVVDHRPHGVRRRWRDPWSRRAGCSPPLADQRDGRDHHRADPGPAAVLRCVDGPAGRRRGRCGSAPAAAVRRAAAHGPGRRAAGLPRVSRGRVGGGSIDRRHPGAHRRGARPGGRHQQGRSGADPASAQRRERPQRRDRDAVRHPVHRRGRSRGISRR